MERPNQCCLKVVEFYAGVGGWHYAIKRSGIPAEVIASVDINTTANKIYRHNFPTTRLLQRNICGLSASDLERLEADMFTMSPPCQPFTRQGKRADTADHRTDSFFHLMQTLRTMNVLPRYIMMENVQGFETSQTREHFVGTLESLGYNIQEFLVSPTQLGIPNSRLRYYLLAKQLPLQFSRKGKGRPCRDVDVLLDLIPAVPELCTEEKDADVSGMGVAQDNCTEVNCAARRQAESASGDAVCQQEETVLPILQESAASCNVAAHGVIVRQLRCFIEDIPDSELGDFLVSDKVLEKYAMGFDIVRPDSTSSCCFTRGYHHYTVGTGSVLQHASSQDLHVAYAQYQQLQKAGDAIASIRSLRCLQLRYFTPREIANLMCFPLAEFSLPSGTSLAQAYRVLGNTVNALVVATFLKYLVLGDPLIV